MKKLLSVYYKIDDALAVIIKYFCAILLAAMIVVCFVNTVGRYAFHHAFRAAEEVVILCAVWVTCVGASMTARADDHVTLDLLQELIKNHRVRAVLYAVTRTLSCAFLLLLPAAFQMVKIYAPTKLTGTGWPQWVLYDAYVVGSIAMVLGYPTILIIDLDVVTAAPPEMNVSGYGDLIATWTAPVDWYLSYTLGMGGNFHTAPSDMIRTRCERLLENSERLAARDPEVIGDLANVLTLSGFSMGLAEGDAAYEAVIQLRPRREIRHELLLAHIREMPGILSVREGSTTEEIV